MICPRQNFFNNSGAVLVHFVADIITNYCDVNFVKLIAFQIKFFLKLSSQRTANFFAAFIVEIIVFTFYLVNYSLNWETPLALKTISKIRGKFCVVNPVLAVLWLFTNREERSWSACGKVLDSS